MKRYARASMQSVLRTYARASMQSIIRTYTRASIESVNSTIRSTVFKVYVLEVQEIVSCPYIYNYISYKLVVSHHASLSL